MKPIVATLLATALSAAFASANAAETPAKPDTATYRTMTQKAAADYKAASAQCKDMSGNARSLCMEEAKVVRARADLAALTDYNNTLKGRTKARTELANADYSLAKIKCADTTGAEKDSCMSNARAVHTAALADVKADRNLQVASTGTTDTMSPVTRTTTTDATKSAAVDKCAQVAGSPNTGCLVDNNKRTADMNTTTTTGAVANRTEMAADSAARRTANAVDNAADKTRAAGATMAAKTERAIDTLADKTERAADNMANKTDRAADKSGAVMADSLITTKVKADIFKEPELKSMAIHVETEKGVVMLSGFVDSKADAEKAVRLAKSVEGVTSVKSAIKVK
ncbi:BON domain-containing protein [Massilia pseudoviolaceinigra]|uniref:BON domain-containing protein n=1 Tax=Massilia pseudoviolaceinigra TaxID=3057165 RepID=UPI0027968ACA|nr:BON domain-containing protein [Massilia sp. CCM 9206]MDQ1922654.1 BON domain-containing protein [Massilia sp. CCM 9206]